MKLPFLEFKKVHHIKPQRKAIFLRQKNNLNNLILPNNSISSVLNNKNKNLESLTQDFYKTQRNINELFYKKGKTIEKLKTKKYIINNNISIINNNIPSNKTNIYESIGNNSESKNRRVFIKNPFDSLKIRKEISSYIYSSPENQIRFINYIMMNKSENKINEESNESNNDIIIPTFVKKKTKIKLIKEIKEIKEKDEDKINFKETSLFSLFFGNNYKKKKEKKDIKTYIRKNNINSIESWDNNLLKNILPQNIKNYYEYNIKDEKNKNESHSNIKNNKVGYYRNNAYQTLNSVNNLRNKTRYDFEGKYKKINMILLNKDKKNKKLEVKSNLKLTRSSSLC